MKYSESNANNEADDSPIAALSVDPEIIHDVLAAQAVDESNADAASTAAAIAILINDAPPTR